MLWPGGSYERLRSIGQRLQKMQTDALGAAGIAHQICGDETVFDVVVADGPCRDYRSAQHDDPNHDAAYTATIRKNSVLKSPGKLYPSLAITEPDLEIAKRLVETAARRIQEH